MRVGQRQQGRGMHLRLGCPGFFYSVKIEYAMCMEWGTQQHQGLATTEMAVTIVVSIDTSSVHMQCFVRKLLAS